jgi:hypothetical protein
MPILLVLAFAAQLAAQPPSGTVDLTVELATRIASRIAPSEAVAIENVSSDDAAKSADIREAINGALRGRGIRIADGSAAATRIHVTCGSNLREQACVAEIRRLAGTEVVAASGPRTEHSDANEMLSLDIRSVFAQQEPMLDVAIAGDRLFVLQPDAVVVYQRADAGWRRLQSQAIAHTRVWPRDVRGRVWLDGDALDVRLPGVSCRGAADLSVLTCADENQPWPIAIENSGVDATRNYFTTREGLPFFAAAPLGPVTNSRWLLADLSGSLALVDATRGSPAIVGAADDVVALMAPCASTPHVLVASASSRQRNADTLRLMRVDGTRLAAASSPLEAAGVVTALWSDRTALAATAIVRNLLGERYEALHIAIGCNR